MPEQEQNRSRTRVRFLERPDRALPEAIGDGASLRTSNRVRFLESPQLDSVAGKNTGPVYSPWAETTPELTWSLSTGSVVTATFSGNACREILRHCETSNQHGHEVGGLLVGYWCAPSGDPLSGCQVVVTDVIPLLSSQSSAAHISFDNSCWDCADVEMQQTFEPQGKWRLGWYHTHPSQGIFFSSHDCDAHALFRLPHQFALVVDPLVMEAGMFFWKDHGERQIAGPLRFALRTIPANDYPATQKSSRALSNNHALVKSCLAIAAVLFTAVTVTHYLDRRAVTATTDISVKSERDSPSLKSVSGLTADKSPGAALPVLPAEAATAPVLSARLRIRRSGRGNLATIDIPVRRASITYGLRQCTSENPETCRTLLVDRKAENRFFQRAFRWNQGVTDHKNIEALQRSIGFSGADADGQWGRRSRLRFLSTAMQPNTNLTIQDGTSDSLNLNFAYQRLSGSGTSKTKEAYGTAR